MATMYYDNDANFEVIAGKKIAILGFGSQGHAHAQNLKESGASVIVGLYEGSRSWPKAEAAGLEVMTVADATKAADVIMMLLPDTRQAQVYESEVAPYITAGKALAFAHGFNIHYNQIRPPKDVDVFMVAPKGPGHLVRRVYEDGKGVPALFAIYQDATGQARQIAMAYAKGIGATRAGILETSFMEETETDLFGEQAVLCGGCTELIKAGFDTLVAAGYQEEIAYFECLHEMKLIVDLFYEGGFEKMRDSISNTAEYGDYVTGKRIITADTRAEMKQVLAEIQDGTFAKNWIMENRINQPTFAAARRIQNAHPIVAVGKRLRSMMSWIGGKDA